MSSKARLVLVLTLVQAVSLLACSSPTSGTPETQNQLKPPANAAFNAGWFIQLDSGTQSQGQPGISGSSLCLCPDETGTVDAGTTIQDAGITKVYCQTVDADVPDTDNTPDSDTPDADVPDSSGPDSDTVDSDTPDTEIPDTGAPDAPYARIPHLCPCVNLPKDAGSPKDSGTWVAPPIY